MGNPLFSQFAFPSKKPLDYPNFLFYACFVVGIDVQITRMDSLRVNPNSQADLDASNMSRLRVKHVGFNACRPANGCSLPFSCFSVIPYGANEQAQWAQLKPFKNSHESF